MNLTAAANELIGMWYGLPDALYNEEVKNIWTDEELTAIIDHLKSVDIYLKRRKPE